MVSTHINLEQIGLHVYNKSHLYDAIVADGWVIPDKKSSFVTLVIIFKIRRRDLWIPRRRKFF